MRRLLLIALLLAAPGALAAPRTLGLFVAAPDGPAGSPRLESAKTDALRVRDTLLRLGGLAADDALLLVGPSPDDVLMSLGELEARARDSLALGEEVTLVVWCAGFVEAGALRLGTRRLELATLTALLQTSPATRRLGLFDLLRTGPEGKAGQRLVADTRGVAGLLLVTSEAPALEAWRSPLSGSSHFAFHVANALRGAADADADGAIGPGELVDWLASRARTPALAKPEAPWPALTQLGAEGLELGSGLAPGLYVVADAEGRVAGELEKRDGPARLWLPPEAYRVKRRAADGLVLATAELLPGQRTTLGAAQFTDAPLTKDPVRQPGPLGGAGLRWSLAAGADYRWFTDAVLPSSPLLGVELTLHRVFLGGLGFGLDAGYGWSSGTLASSLVGAQPWSASLTTVGLSARYEWLRERRLTPFAGVRLELDFLARVFTDPSWATQAATLLAPGAFVGLKVRLGLGLSLVARARLGYVSLAIDTTRNLAAGDVGVQLRYEFGG